MVPTAELPRLEAVGAGRLAQACVVRPRLTGLLMYAYHYSEEFLYVYDDFFTYRKKFSG
jgi:hypothetical protein